MFRNGWTSRCSCVRKAADPENEHFDSTDPILRLTSPLNIVRVSRHGKNLNGLQKLILLASVSVFYSENIPSKNISFFSVESYPHQKQHPTSLLAVPSLYGRYSSPRAANGIEGHRGFLCQQQHCCAGPTLSRRVSTFYMDMVEAPVESVLRTPGDELGRDTEMGQADVSGRSLAPAISSLF